MNVLSIPTPTIHAGSTLSTTTSAGKAETAPLTALTNGALFKAALSTSLAATVAKTSPSSSTATAKATASASPDAELAQRIKTLLDKGTSQTDVIASLSNSLAASVATALGIPLDAAKQQLTAAFTAALNPTGSGPPQSNAERATSLAQRFRQIAELATRVTKEDPGQTIRSISGKSSDAEQAGAGPAPSPDRIIREAATALAATASSATQTIPTSQAPAGDGRVVVLPAATAIATGGDTPIGRILTRAVNANPSSTGPTAAPVTVSDDAVKTATTEIVQRSQTPTVKSLDAIAPTASTSSQSAPTTGHTTVATALDAFVQAFDAALKHDDAPRSTPADPNASLPSIPVDPTLAAGTTSTPQQVAPSLAVPTVNAVAAIAPPAPAPTLPQPVPVDPNAVVDQVLRGVNVRTSDGSSEVRLRLVPENLGDVSVKLIVTGGSVDASITTHTADAQNVLAGAQSQLAKTLADAGLKLQSFSVGLAGGGFADARDQQPSSQWANRSTSRRIGAVAAADSEEPVDPSLLAEPSFAPPIYTASTQHGLNYLV